MLKSEKARLLLYLIILSIIAFGVRIFFILNTDPLADEIWVLLLIKNSFKDIWIGAISDSNAPFYYLFLRVVSIVFDKQLNILGYRLLSLFWGGLSSLGIWYLARLIFNQKTALICFFMTLFFPSFIWVSVTGRYYSFLILLTTLYLMFFIRFINSKKIWPLFLLIIISIIGLHTHYYYALLILAKTIFLAIFKKSRSLYIKWFWYLLSVSLVSTPLLYYFWLFPKYKVANINNNMLKIPALFLSQITSFSLLIYFYQFIKKSSIQYYLYIAILVGLFLLALKLFVEGVRKIKGVLRALFLTTLIVPPVITLIVSYAVRPALAVNSFLIFLPIFLLILAKGIEVDLIRKKVLSLISIFMIFILFIAFFRSFSVSAYFTEPFIYVRSKLSDKDIVLHSEMYTFILAKYYLGEGINFGVNSTLTTKETERIHGFKLLSDKELSKHKGKIWYFQPQFYNVTEAKLGKNRLDQNFNLVNEKKFLKPMINVYLYSNVD